jgi:hypothetical protein
VIKKAICFIPLFVLCLATSVLAGWGFHNAWLDEEDSAL